VIAVARRPAAASASVALLAERTANSLGRSRSQRVCVAAQQARTDAEAAAGRLATAITELGTPGLGACAGVAALEVGATATETMSRAALSLQTARSLGAGRVIRYAGTR
jgi:hypothetical protein